MSEISEFLESYDKTLREGVSDSDMHPGLTERLTFDSCVKRQDGREVYFVTRKADGKRAVLRVTDADSGENAADENAILARLNHPAIPKTLGVWKHKGRSFLVREYFAGDDLHAYIRKHGPLSRSMLTDTALQLCDILTYIHGQSPAVIHRDIKPENIVLSGRDGVKLIDFGIARGFRQEAEKDTKVAGTRPYMAPEQFGSEQTDNRADIYSLGVLMLYMATGKTDKTNLRAEFPYKELTPIIAKCIRKDRERRYKTAELLKRRIRRAQSGLRRKILLIAGVCAAVAGAFMLGESLGEKRGFQNGIDSIMAVPGDVNRPFTQEELNETVTFDSFYLDLAVRTALNIQLEDPIYRYDVNSRLGELVVYGTAIMAPSLEEVLLKTHVDKGVVRFITNSGWQINERGDISTLEEIPNMYYLRKLTLTSQNISDLSPLSGMKLESINLTDNFVGNLLPLKDMVMLRELDLCLNPLRDLTPISRLLSLEKLDISQTQVTDLTPLAELTKLQTLNLEYCDAEDLGILAGLTALREVDVSNTRVKDLSPLLRSEDNPMSVRCVGLPDEVIDAVRDDPGIVLIEE